MRNVPVVVDWKGVATGPARACPGLGWQTPLLRIAFAPGGTSDHRATPKNWVWLWRQVGSRLSLVFDGHPVFIQGQKFRIQSSLLPFVNSSGGCFFSGWNGREKEDGAPISKKPYQAVFSAFIGRPPTYETGESWFDNVRLIQSSVTRGLGAQEEPA